MMEKQAIKDRIFSLSDEFSGHGRIRKFSGKVGISEKLGRAILELGQIPKADTLLKIATAYNKTVDWLLTGGDVPNQKNGDEFMSQVEPLRNDIAFPLLIQAYHVYRGTAVIDGAGGDVIINAIDTALKMVAELYGVKDNDLERFLATGGRNKSANKPDKKRLQPPNG